MITITLCLALLALFSSACRFITGNQVRGSGKVTTEERSVSGIQAVAHRSFGDLIIQVGEQESLLIEAEDNILPHLKTEVRAGTLYIETDNVPLSTLRPVIYRLTVKSLNGIELSGSGNVECDPLPQAEKLTLATTGSGSLRLAGLEADRADLSISGSGQISVEQVKAQNLSATLTGSGDVRLTSGQVDNQSVSCTGSGRYNAGGLLSRSADVRLTGSGDAQVNVSDTLKGALSGSGDLRYTGSPKLDSSVTGSGRIVSTK